MRSWQRENSARPIAARHEARGPTGVETMSTGCSPTGRKLSPEPGLSRRFPLVPIEVDQGHFPRRVGDERKQTVSRSMRSGQRLMSSPPGDTPYASRPHRHDNRVRSRDRSAASGRLRAPALATGAARTAQIALHFCASVLRAAQSEHDAAVAGAALIGSMTPMYSP